MKEFTSETISTLKLFYHQFNSKLSDISLTNLVIWNTKYDFWYEIITDYLIIALKMTDESVRYSMPIGGGREEKLKVIERLISFNENNIIIYNADEDFIHLLEMTDYSFKIESNRDDADYIYSFEDLKNLPGKKFHKKKNLVNNFEKQYQEWSFRTYLAGDYSLVLSFLEEWYEDKGNIENLMREWEGIIQALKSYGDLNFEGGLLFVGKALVGFTMVEMLTADTLVIHIEKANIAYKGAYNMLQYQMLQRYDDQVKWVNREQDIGIESLRKVKMSYKPAFFEYKYTITIKLFQKNDKQEC